MVRTVIEEQGTQQQLPDLSLRHCFHIRLPLPPSHPHPHLQGTCRCNCRKSTSTSSCSGGGGWGEGARIGTEKWSEEDSRRGVGMGVGATFMIIKK